MCCLRNTDRPTLVHQDNSNQDELLKLLLNGILNDFVYHSVPIRDDLLK